MFTYSETTPMQFAEARADVYPYLLVNIGSGVSMVKVSGPRQFERVGGTSLGGGTFWGLMALLTGARTFDEMLAMAERGDNSGVDMLVGDIYGTDYGKIGLKSTAIASTFGKVLKLKRLEERNAENSGSESPTSEQDISHFSYEDMSQSLLFAIRYVLQVLFTPIPQAKLTAAVTISAKSHIYNLKNTRLNTYTLEARLSVATARP